MMLQGAMIVWFILTGASVAFVVWDSLTNGVTSWVQRLAWILVTVYTGPVGAFFYVLACRRPFPGGHDRYTAATWKQGMNSEMHCLAGDATGIIVAAAIVPALGLANGWDVLIEYTAGFVFGLFIFQALMMVRMYQGDYFRAVRKTFFAEAVSMNLVMTGMIPVMLILAAAWPHSMNPAGPAFWFRMSLASIAGGILAFPINRWLVRNHLKHGCMTLPGADGPAPGLGHRSPEMPGGDGMVVAHEQLPDMPVQEHAGSARGSQPVHTGQAQDIRPHGQAMTMRELPYGRALLWIAGTFLVLLLALWVTAQWVPIEFAQRGGGKSGGCRQPSGVLKGLCDIPAVAQGKMELSPLFRNYFARVI